MRTINLILLHIVGKIIGLVKTLLQIFLVLVFCFSIVVLVMVFYDYITIDLGVKIFQK